VIYSWLAFLHVLLGAWPGQTILVASFALAMILFFKSSGPSRRIIPVTLRVTLIVSIISGLTVAILLYKSTFFLEIFVIPFAIFGFALIAFLPALVGAFVSAKILQLNNSGFNNAEN
jgi:hypothetical protein